VTPESPKNKKAQKSLVNARFSPSLNSCVREVITSNIGVAIANLAKANVIGGISASASLMKIKLAAQMHTIVPAKVNEINVLFVVAIFF